MIVKINDLKELALLALKKYGYTEDESQTILDILMYAQLRGNNQGLVKLIGKGIPKSPDAGKISLQRIQNFRLLSMAPKTWE